LCGTRIVYRIVIERPLEKLLLVKQKRRCEDNIKMDFRKMDGTSSESCPVVSFDIRAFESSCSVAAAVMFVLLIGSRLRFVGPR
jgi:hypothetical protein